MSDDMFPQKERNRRTLVLLKIVLLYAGMTLCTITGMALPSGEHKQVFALMGGLLCAWGIGMIVGKEMA